MKHWNLFKKIGICVKHQIWVWKQQKNIDFCLVYLINNEYYADVNIVELSTMCGSIHSIPATPVSQNLSQNMIKIENVSLFLWKILWKIGDKTSWAISKLYHLKHYKFSFLTIQKKHWDYYIREQLKVFRYFVKKFGHFIDNTIFYS